MKLTEEDINQLNKLKQYLLDNEEADEQLMKDADLDTYPLLLLEKLMEKAGVDNG